MGSPKCATLAVGPHSIGINLPHTNIITTNVNPEVMNVYLNILFKRILTLKSGLYSLLARYHPTGNPNIIEKKGTHIPKGPKHIKSIII